MQNNILETANELESLFLNYKELAKSKLPKEVSNFGMITLYEKMLQILSSDEVYPIVVKEVPYPFEDYIYHVLDDTPTFIAKLRKYIQDNE